MSVDTPDAAVVRHTPTGLLLAVTSALSFGTSGTMARGLMDAGWSPGAAFAVRVSLAALVLAIPGLLAVRGRYGLLLTHARTIVLYGLSAVVCAQLFYFMAVQRLDVGIALLIEYTAPVAVVLWMWLAHGQRPGRFTLIGAVVAAVGLALLLDVFGGAELDLIGVMLALVAMAGAAAYFVMSADDSSGLPPLTLAAGGLVVASVTFWIVAATGLLPLTMTKEQVTFATGSVPWWVPVLVLGFVAAALAYGTGIAAARHLGGRLASFVALTEVAAGLGFAWVLLDQVPKPLQLVGALLILGGIVVVKLGEREVVSVGGDQDLLVEPLPAQEPPHRG
ncbi:EamA family transporter [Aeromicrobium tamlense]|uniref:Drug/metabolite transporter (DMT)-like permease n=1 Tax=Aeromicrobium tamlense TaxID=375541 RepID=A0A8I0G2N7_9ACTN|nr:MULTISPECIES: DMT family transporter [Aeromicrobium]MBD1271774.1 EamA family transporter [Aeromicrobium tamlense]NYI39038.1 drug/metabolite transporter (DMT)-like permease [Aeromicrobium tamlense]